MWKQACLTCMVFRGQEFGAPEHRMGPFRNLTWGCNASYNRGQFVMNLNARPQKFARGSWKFPRWGPQALDKNTHEGINKLDHHWFRYWLDISLIQNHCLNQCCPIINWTLGKNFIEIWIKIQYNSSNKINLKMIPATKQHQQHPFCLSLSRQTERQAHWGQPYLHWW